MRRSLIVLATALAGAVVISPATAGAATTWTCSASLVKLSSPLPTPLDVIEPARAAGPDCAGDYRGFQATGLPALDGMPVSVTAAGGYSATNTDSNGTRRSEAAVSDLRIRIGEAEQALDVRVQAITSRVALAGCAGAEANDGKVAGLLVNGADVLAELDPGGVAQLASGLGPLAPILRIEANNASDPLGPESRRALRLEVLAVAGGTPLVRIDLGEVRVTRPAPCADVPATPTAPVAGTNTNTSTNTNTNTNTAGATRTPDGRTSGTGTTAASRRATANGTNGGCGVIKMWFVKVRKHGTLKGRPTTATTRFGDRAVLRGRLLSCGGRPIVGARIDQHHVFGGKSLRKTGLRSRAGGALTLILPTNVATRSVRFTYRGSLASAKVSSRITLKLRVRDRNGRLLRSPPRSSLR